MDELIANYSGIVFTKTEKGREEMSSRAHGLNPPQRRVLIIVDGVRNFETIVEIIPSIIPKDQMGEIFSFLIRHGYIVAMGVNTAASDETGEILVKDGAAATSAEKQETELTDDPTTIRIVKDFMTTTAQTYLGLLGSGIIQRIERAKTAEQLLSVLGQWNMALHESNQGRRFAAASMQQVKDALTGHGRFMLGEMTAGSKALQS